MKKKNGIGIGLIIVLLIINIVLRVPVTPHEKGADTFLTHIMADSITQNAYVKWNLNPLSIFGLYPLSGGNGAIIHLSEITQILGTSMETSIFIASLLIAVISALSAYVLALKLNRSKLFAFFVALSFSTSNIFISLSHWSASTRIWFIAILPLFLWSMLKVKESNKSKYYLLTTMIFVCMATIHKLFVIHIVLLICFIAALLFSMLDKKIKFKSYKNYFMGAFFTFALLVLIVVGLFILTEISTTSYKLKDVTRVGSIQLFEDIVVLKILSYNIISIGILSVFVIPGIFYLFFKSKKTFTDFFLIFSILIFGFLLPEIQYSFQYSLIFVSLFIGYGVMFSRKILVKIKLSKVFPYLVVGMLLFHFGISGYILIHQSPTSSSIGSESWAREDIYASAIFFKNLDNEGVITSNVLGAQPLIFAAYSEKPYGPPHERLYLIFSDNPKQDITIDTKDFGQWIDEFRDIYVLKDPDIFRDSRDILYHSLDNPNSRRIMEEYNINYVLENTLAEGNYVMPGQIGTSHMLRSLDKDKSEFYNNGRISIWYLGK